MITFDSSNATTEGISATTRSWTHTIGTGSNRILIVGTNLVSDTASTRVSGITYNSIALTNATWVWNGQTIEIWYLLNPSTGSNTITATWNNGGNNRVYATSLSYFNVSQTSPINITGTNAQNTQTSVSVGLTTTISPTLLIDTVGVEQETLTISVGSSQTQRANATLSTNIFAMSDKSSLVTGSNTMSWTINGGTSNYEVAGIALKSVPDGGLLFSDI